MAPGAKVRVYATTDLDFVHLDQAYQAIINDLPSQPTLHQVSLSYGLGETYESAAQMQTDAQYFASLAASGCNHFCFLRRRRLQPRAKWLGGQFRALAGGVSSERSERYFGGWDQSFLNSSTGAVSSESAWSFGGGGSSQFFARPSWQTGAGVPPGAFRTVPDVALAADLNTGGYLIFGRPSDTWLAARAGAHRLGQVFAR